MNAISKMHGWRVHETPPVETSNHWTSECYDENNKKKVKKKSVFECYVAILFLNISENFNRELGGGWSKKKIYIKRGILQQILVLLP